MNTPFSLRSRRFALLAALSCAMIPLVASIVHSDPTCAIAGSPDGPTTVALGVPYKIATIATPDQGYKVTGVSIASNSSGPDGPSDYNPWITHGYYSVEDEDFGSVPHVFNVVNQNHGYYYWRPGVSEIRFLGSQQYTDCTSYTGYYFTPYY